MDSLETVQNQINYYLTRWMLRWRTERKTSKTEWKMSSMITDLEMEIGYISETHRYTETDKQMEKGTAD